MNSEGLMDWSVVNSDDMTLITVSTIWTGDLTNRVLPNTYHNILIIENDKSKK